MQSVVAKIKAADADIGSNAEMDYRIMDSDGPGMFNITTDEDTQDGIIILLKVMCKWCDKPHTMNCGSLFLPLSTSHSRTRYHVPSLPLTWAL